MTTYAVSSTEIGSSPITMNSTLTMAELTTAETVTGGHGNAGEGFAAIGIAVFLYGITYAPVKKFDTGDGMFFQWVYCSAAMFVGIIIQWIRGCPTFYPLVMLGGALFATGNICVVPIVKCIGLGLGLCIWGMLNLLSGWSTGRFGFFGVKKQVPTDVNMNYIGVALAVSSSVLFALVKSEVSTAGIDSTIVVTDSERSPLLSPSNQQRGSMHTTHMAHHDVVVFSERRRKSSGINGTAEQLMEDSDESFVDRLAPRGKRILGLALCVFSGLLYGQTFTPAIHAQDNYEGASKNGLDYVFATFCGIYLTSTAYFLIYAAYQRNRPKIYPRVILPGFIAGVLWSIATAGWFVANKVLSEAIAFPIVSTGPGVITAFLGVFVFHEIKGRRNYLILLLAMSVTITGAILTGFSF